jgi:hypothetical protein
MIELPSLMKQQQAPESLSPLTLPLRCHCWSDAAFGRVQESLQLCTDTNSEHRFLKAVLPHARNQIFSNLYNSGQNEGSSNLY